MKVQRMSRDDIDRRRSLVNDVRKGELVIDDKIDLDRLAT